MFIGLNNAITGLTQDQLSKTINSLFSKNEQGVWYDPSDMSTMFQDEAGTTPVTAVEQPVGRMLDKSGRGNHATQATTASRPVLSARVNLLQKTEEFSEAVWEKTSVTISSNAITAPNGTLSADKLVEGSGSVSPYILQHIALISEATYTQTIFAKAAERSVLQITPSIGFNGASVWFQNFDLTNGTLGTSVGTLNSSIRHVGNGWYQCSVQDLNVSGYGRFVISIVESANSTRLQSYTGDGTSGVYLWGADLRVANTGVNLPAYQRVNTATDYDTAGFPHYLQFDGVDDYLSTGSIDFTATDKMTVLVGVMAITPSFLIICELSNSVNSNNGSFYISCYTSGSYAAGSKGTILKDAVSAKIYPYPTTNTITLVGDISGDRSILRVNGSQVSKNMGDQGTGNYGNYPLYIGRRGGASLPFKGRLYGLVIRGALSSTGEIQGAESYMNLHTGAY